MCVCLTVQLGVQLPQVRGHGGDQDLHRGVCRADLKARLVGEHGEHWRSSGEDQQGRVEVELTCTTQR